MAVNRDRAAHGSAGRLEPSGHRDITAGTAAQNDRAAARASRSDREIARHIDRVANCLRDRCCLEHDRPSRGANLAGNVNERLTVGRLRIGRDGDLQKIVAGQVQRRLLSRTHRDFSQGHGDDTRIGDRSADEPDKAAGGCLNQAGVGDARGGAVAGEAQIAAVEVVVGDSEGRGDETAADLNGAGRGDRDAVRINEIDLAVGLQLPGDRRARRAGDAIEDRRGGAWLIEGHAVALADGEAAPIDDCARRRLGHRQIGSGLTN